MMERKELVSSITVDGKKYTWDGQLFYNKNKARVQARKYLRRGFKVDMETDDGTFYVYRHHPYRQDESVPQ